MAAVPFPSGRYLVAFNQVRTVAGGQTHALLQRTRHLAEHAGLPSAILTFDAHPDYARTEADLRASGALHPDVALLNIHDHLCERPIEPTGGDTEPPLADLGAVRSHAEHRADGTLWRTRHENALNLTTLAFDYHRADGSVYLRTLPLTMEEPVEHDRAVQLVDPSGGVVRSFRSLGAWWAWWLAELVGDTEPVWLFVDSMMLPAHLAHRLDDRFRQVAVMHMAHVYAPRRWDSPQHPPARRSLEQLEHFDAFVLLTQRQRQDVEAAYGARSHVRVLPNPGVVPPEPDPLPVRSGRRLVVIARLERVKRVEAAVRAMAHVVEEVPDAHLDVYGEGRARGHLQALVAELGLTGSVTLHGHTPDAREQLWQAAALLVTSRSEGFPIAPLEAHARCCPVVAFDIKYGPREQVVDGETGYLVPPGDEQALAERCVRLLRDPALVARMGRAGRDHVRDDLASFADRWAQVLVDAEERRPCRTRLREVSLTVEQADTVGRSAGRLLRRRGGPEPRLGLSVRLDVAHDPTATPVAEAVLDLDAVDHSGEVVPVPATVTREVREGSARFTLVADLDPASLRAQVPGPLDAHLRLRLTWANSAWETVLRRPVSAAPPAEVGAGEGDRLHLRTRD